MKLPAKIKKDAILEALVEIRFDTGELPELIVGYLINYDPWRKYQRSRTPIADLPATIRWSQPDLRYQPILELKSNDGKVSVKIGERVLSFHRSHEYPGWEGFSKEVSEVLEHLFSKFDGVKIERLGLRYLNSLNADDHFISHAGELNINVSIQEVPITEKFNFNYGQEHGVDFKSLTKIATPDFVEGNLPKNSSAYVDIDVFSSAGYSTQDKEEVMKWIEKAHDIEKKIFFQLIPDEKVDQLVSE